MAVLPLAQYVLVFYKGDPKRIKPLFGEVPPPGAHPVEDTSSD